MKNRLSKNSSMKIPVHYTCRGKLKTKIVAHKILPLKSCSSLKSPQTVISIIFLYLTEKQPSEILRLLLEIQTRWFDVCCTVKSVVTPTVCSREFILSYVTNHVLKMADKCRFGRSLSEASYAFYNTI